MEIIIDKSETKKKDLAKIVVVGVDGDKPPRQLPAVAVPRPLRSSWARSKRCGVVGSGDTAAGNGRVLPPRKHDGRQRRAVSSATASARLR